MGTDATDPSLGRDRTDESLRSERDQADRVVAEQRTAVERDADDVVQLARDNADAVLSVARGEADLQMDRAETHAATRDEVDGEREVADQVLREERAVADKVLDRERAANAAALSRLLPLERDQTDRHLLTERARSDHAVANRDDFLGIVSHDLRNLLSGIVLSADAVVTKGGTAEHEQQTVTAVALILRYAARMNRLIGDLIDVASIDAGRLAMTPIAGDWAVVVTEAVDAFRAAAAAKGLGLNAELATPSLPGEFDHDRILQVLANLVTNAIKFTSGGGGITITAGRAGDAIRIVVSDTGAGIPASMLESIFERFWQVRSDDKRGLGLGLYISRCIVEAHGGRIWAESEPGAGTRLCFTVPVTPLA